MYCVDLLVDAAAYSPARILPCSPEGKIASRAARWQVTGQRAAMVVARGAVRFSARAGANHGGSPGTRRRRIRRGRPGRRDPRARRLDRFRRVRPSPIAKGTTTSPAFPRGTYTVTAEASGFRHRDHRGAERRRRPHAGAQLSPGGWRTKRDRRRPRGSAAGRSRVGHRRARGHADRPCSRCR